MYHTPQSPIRKDWVALHQEENLLPGLVCEVVVSDVDGRTLVLNSKPEITTGAYSVMGGSLSEPWVEGETYTVTIKGSVNTPNHLRLYRDNGYAIAAHLTEYDAERGVYTATFVCPAQRQGEDPYKYTLYNFPKDTATNASVEWIKIERGIPADPVEMSSISGAGEFDVLACNLVDEIDPLFLSVPIPHGDVTFSFADEEMGQGTFYDEVVSRFKEGMTVSVSLGYKGQGSLDGMVTWGGYYVTNVQSDVVQRTVTLQFQHTVAKRAETLVFPYNQPLFLTPNGPYAVLIDSMRQLAEQVPEVDFSGISSSKRHPGYVAPDSTVNALTCLANSLPCQFVMSHSGVLTAEQGYFCPPQEVSVWEVELLDEGVVKEPFSAGNPKQSVQVVGYPETKTFELSHQKGGGNTFESLNFQPITNVVSSDVVTTTTVYPGEALVPEEAGKDYVMGSMQLQCVGVGGGRVIGSLGVRADTTAMLGPEEFTFNPETSDITVQHQSVDVGSSSGSITDIEKLNNPYVTNVDACYTYPNENYQFKLVGKMRDNPSLKPNQQIRIPYNNMWAKMVLTKTARSFSGGAWLEFEGIVVEITDEVIRPPTSFRAHLEVTYQRVPEPPGNLGYNLMVTVKPIPTLWRPPLHTLPPMPRFWGTATYPDGTSESFGSREDTSTSFQLENTGLTKEEFLETQWDINMEYDWVVYSPTDIIHYGLDDLNNPVAPPADGIVAGCDIYSPADRLYYETQNNPMAPLAGNTVAGSHTTVTKRKARKA